MIKLYHSTAKAVSLKEIATKKAGCWVHVVAPNESELDEVATNYELERDLLVDAVDLYESPRVERDGDDVYVFIRYYHPNNGVINATEPLLIVYKPTQIITIMRTDSAVLAPLLKGKEEVITTKRAKTMLQIMEAVNVSYAAYVTRVTRSIFGARSQIRQKQKDISQDTLLGFVEMEDDLNEFLSALQPQAVVLRSLLGSKYIRFYEEDRDLVEDLSLGTTELIELVKSRLKTIVTIRESYDAIAANQLNKTFRRLTSISIFLMVPTVVSGLYGMNVRLPFADGPYTFLWVLGFIGLASTMLVLVFKKQRWL